MKKILPLSIFIFLVSVSFAQTRTTVYKGRTIKIFPYRIQIESYSDNGFGDLMLDKLAVPYCPEKLEDGEYIIYYRPDIDLNDEKSMEKFARGDTLFIAINYSVKNGVRDGPVYFFEYTKQKKPIATGYYANDMKSGLWKSERNEFKMTAEFKSDKMDGKIILEIKKKKQKIIGYFKNGELDGRIEFYQGKKLTGFAHSKAGKPYGPYYHNPELYDEKNGNNYIIGGFSLPNGIDSFTRFYTKKNKMVQSCLNSHTPLPGSDTTEMDWYVGIQNFKLAVTDVLYKSYNYTEIENETLYSNCYEIGLKGNPINNLFFIDKKIKIPFVYLNSWGDTILKAERLEKTKDYIKFKVTESVFDKYHYLIIKSERTVTGILKLKENSNEKYLDTVIYKINYNNETIVKSYTLNRPVAGYRGFLIKTDSTSKLDTKTLEQLSFTESYEIKLLNRNFTTYASKYGDNIYSHTYPDITYQLKGKDTLEVTEKNAIDSLLNVSFTQLLCLNDSAVIWHGGANLINPYEACKSWNSYGSFIGQSDHVFYYRNKPYSGILFIENKFSKKIKPFNSKLKHEEKDKALYLTRILPKERTIKRILKTGLKKVRKVLKRKKYYYEKSTPTRQKPNEYLYSFKNGKLHGYQRATNEDGLIYELNFKNGISHGVQNYCLEKTSVSTLEYYQFLSKINYDSGRIDGYVVINNADNSPGLITKYNKDKLNGQYVEFDKNLSFSEPKPSLETKFVNDTLDGYLITYYAGVERERIPFIKGKATGYYYKNRIQKFEAENSDSVHNYEPYTKINRELKIKLNNGVIEDTAFAYFEDGSIKYIAVMETDFYHKYINTSKYAITKPSVYIQDSMLMEELFPAAISSDNYDEATVSEQVTEATDVVYGKNGGIIDFGITNFGNEKSVDLDPMFDNPKATFTFYYKNGVKSQQGKMVFGLKYRTWKYWNENGTLLKEIEYKPGVDSSTENTIYYKGKITAYYPSGKKMCAGLITDEELSYQCNQEVEVAYEFVYYLTFFDEAGNSILNNLSGPVTDYHLNGKKRFAGQITKGKRTGLWKFYDPDGNLKSIGEYADGVKHGKWLKGDLGGINYIDNACSVNEALSLTKERQQQDIDVTEILYEMGKRISESHLVLEKF